MSRRYVIAIDGGTTNTRARVLADGIKVIASSSVRVGARSTSAAPGGCDNLKLGTAKAIRSALRQAGVAASEVAQVVASGMITCEAGLLEVPHISAPAGISDLTAAAKAMLIPEVWPEPIIFIPGIKFVPQRLTEAAAAFALEVASGPATTHFSFEDLSVSDMMRGEESESFGILELTGIQGPLLLALPGSHSKYILIDHEKKIVASTTTLAGELASAVASGTLLSRSLESGISLDDFREQDALAGFEAAMQQGLTRSLFMVRLLDRIAGAPLATRRSFLWGAIGAMDVMALLGNQAIRPYITEQKRNFRMLIGGSLPLRQLFGFLMHHWFGQSSGSRIKIEILPSSVADQASAVGAALIAKPLIATFPRD